MSEESAPAIQTVQRAAEILNAFTVSRPWLNLNQITEAIGTSKATAHRYTKALRETGLLRYDSSRALFALGPEVLALETAARAGLPIVATAEPHLARIVRETGYSAVLALWDGETATVVRCIDNIDGALRLRIAGGTRLDLIESAQGRIFCTYLPPEMVTPLDRRLRVSPDLADQLEEIARTGVCAGAPPVQGIHTVASPVFEEGRIIATAGIIGTEEMFARDERQGLDLSAAVLAMARALSAELGTRPEDWPTRRRTAGS